MKTWLRHHWLAMVQAGKNVRHAPSSFLLNTAVIAIAFALPLTGLTVLENIRPMALQMAVEPEISVFLGKDVPRPDALALRDQIGRVLQDSKRSGKIEFLPREKAFTQLNQKTGLSEALAILGDNPLPDGYLIRLPAFENAAAAAEIEPLATHLRALKGVEHVQVDSAWIKRLAALVHLIGVTLAILAATLSVVVVTVVFNTIRLQVMMQREEIAVSRLVGATAAYIYRPFYYTGALLGVSATAVALGTVTVILHVLNNAVAVFAHLYGSTFVLAPLDLLASALLLGVGGALGFAGAALCVSRQLVTADQQHRTMLRCNLFASTRSKSMSDFGS